MVQLPGKNNNPTTGGSIIAEAGKGAGAKGSFEVTTHKRGGDRHEAMHQAYQLGAVAAFGIAVALEQLDCVIDDILDVGGVAHREGGELFERNTLADQGPGGDEHVNGVRREPLLRTLTDRSEQTGAHDDVDNEFGDLCSSGEFGLIEIRIGCILFGEIAEESGAVAVGECPYLGEAESLLCKASDFSNSVEMVIVIEGATAFTARRRKQLFALVVANRVDRDSGPIGEFFDVVVHAHIVGVVTPRVATRLDGQRLRSAS